jgi:hypothetical protein
MSLTRALVLSLAASSPSSRSFRNESNMQLKQTRSADALAEELRKSFVASEASDISDDEDLMGKVMREARSSLAAARLAELDLDYIPPPPPDTPPPLDPPPPPRNQLSTTHSVSVKKLSQTGVANKQGFLNQSVAAAVMTRGPEPASATSGGAPANDETPPPPPPPDSPSTSASAKPTHHSSLSGVFGQSKPPEKKPVPLPSQLPRPSSHSVINPPPSLASNISEDGAMDVPRESRTSRTQSEANLMSPRSDSISLVKGAGGRVVREKVFGNGDK